MNILLISRENFDFEGRLQELCRVFSQLGRLYAFTLGSTPCWKDHAVCSLPCNGRHYLRFVRSAVSYGQSVGQVDLLVIDNTYAALPGMILRRKLWPAMTVQDCPELYLTKYCTSFKSRTICKLEQMSARRADVVICANQERAGMMEREFCLKRRPLVFENVRQLSYSSDSAPEEQEARFSGLLHDGELRIFSSDGWNLSRGTGDLIRALPRVGRKCRLYLAGAGSPDERQAVESIVAEEGLENVELLGKLDHDALKYLISVCHIGIVTYGRRTPNDLYCASGKLYEFIYEGLPVVTTTNPPLKRLCDTYHIGVSDDGYSDGIREVAEQYEEYQQNVRSFARTHTVEDNNANLIQQLRERFFAIS